MGQVILLNDKSYVATAIRRYTVDPRGLQQRTTGEHQRSDNGKITSAIYDNWDKTGIGWRKNRRRTGRGVGGMWKSTSETRFAESAYNGLMEAAQTHAGPADHVRRYVNFNGSLFGVFEEEYASGAINTAVTRKFNGGTDTWDDSDTGLNPTFGADTIGSGTGTNKTVSHTAQTVNGNRLVVATVAQYDAGGGGLGTVTAATYQSVAMTLLGTVTAGSTKLSIYYLVDPPTTGTFSVTISASDEMLVHVGDYYNVDQLKPFRYSATNSSSGAQSLSVAQQVHDDDLVIGAFNHRPSTGSQGAMTQGTGQTETSEFSNGSSSHEVATSYERSGTTSTTFDHSYTTDANSGPCCAIGGVLSAPNGVITVAQANITGIRIFDACTHKGRLWIIGSAGEASEQTYGIWSSGDGAAFVSHSGSNWPTGNLLTTTVTRRNNYNDDMARLLDDGDTLWAFVRNNPDNEIECYTTTNQAVTWTNEFDIPSADGPKGAAVWYDRKGTQFALLAAAEGVYSLDDTNNIFIKEIPLDGQASNGRVMTVGDDGNLYLPLGDDDVLQAKLGSQGGGADTTLHFERIGPMAAHDGLPAEWRGTVNYISSGNSVGGLASRWLWVAYGGSGASKTATIMCYDYAISEQVGYPVWHCFHDAQENSVTGMGQNVVLTQLGLSAHSDGTPRLHVAAEGTATSLMFGFTEPLRSRRNG